MAPKEGQEGADSGDDGSTVITSTHSTLLTLPLGSSFSLHVKFTASASSTTEPSEPLPPASSLKALVQQACRRFYLLHGPLSSLLPSRPTDGVDVARTRRKVHGTLEHFWSEWIEHFPARTDQLISKSHGLRLPPISVTPTTLPQPLALLSRSIILTSPSAQLPSELLHHLLTLVPQPSAEVAAPQPQNGVVEKEGNKWWDGLGTGMSTMTLGLGRSSSAPPSEPTEKKTSFPASYLWKKATTDLFSFGSSASTPPSPSRLPVRASEDPKAPVDVSLPPSTPSTPIEDGEGAKAVDPESLKEAIEQELPEPEPISLSWSTRDFWLSETKPSPVAFTLVGLQNLISNSRSAVCLTILRSQVPDRADSSISNRLFVYLPSPSCTADPPSLASLLNFVSPSPPPPTPPAQAEQQAHEDQRSFHPPPKPTLSRSPSAISLLSTFTTPPRPSNSTPAKNVSVCGLMKGRDGRVGMTGSWRPIDEGKRERSLVRNLNLLSE